MFKKSRKRKVTGLVVLLAVATALAHWGSPDVSGATRENLMSFSRRAQRTIRADWEQVTYRILRQNALRALIPMTPDWQTC